MLSAVTQTALVLLKRLPPVIIKAILLYQPSKSVTLEDVVLQEDLAVWVLILINVLLLEALTFVKVFGLLQVLLVIIALVLVVIPLIRSVHPSLTVIALERIKFIWVMPALVQDVISVDAVIAMGTVLFHLQATVFLLASSLGLVIVAPLQIVVCHPLSILLKVLAVLVILAP